MHLPRAAIVRHLRERGRDEDAIRAERDLPERIHTVQDVELLERWGIDPSAIEGETFRDLPPRDT
jgi:hypothetical protein